MATFHGHGLRGSTLEDLINRTNEAYRQAGLALIQKIPTPVTPVEMNQDRQITLAYFDQKSTVDYIGTVQGIPVCFDAKECAEDTFPLKNIREHQLAFMRDFEKQGGVAFLLLMYTGRNEYYYMPLRQLECFFRRMEEGGRRSFRYEEIGSCYPLRRKGEYLCHYLEGIQQDLEEKENMQS